MRDWVDYKETTEHIRLNKSYFSQTEKHHDFVKFFLWRSPSSFHLLSLLPLQYWFHLYVQKKSFLSHVSTSAYGNKDISLGTGNFLLCKTLKCYTDCNYYHIPLERTLSFGHTFSWREPSKQIPLQGGTWWVGLLRVFGDIFQLSDLSGIAWVAKSHSFCLRTSLRESYMQWLVLVGLWSLAPSPKPKTTLKAYSFSQAPMGPTKAGLGHELSLRPHLLLPCFHRYFSQTLSFPISRHSTLHLRVSFRRNPITNNDTVFH